MKKVNVPVFIPHLACKNDCIFCNQKKISRTIVPIKPSEIENLTVPVIENVKDKQQAEIAFFGGSFTGIDKSMMISYLEAAEKLVCRYGLYGIRMSTRPDYINEEILNILSDYKVKTIELGVQSMNDDVLFYNRRGHKAYDTKAASKLIKSKGYDLILQMMTGMYKDSYEKDLYTAKEIIKLKPDGVRIYPTVVVKDTLLCELYNKGEFIPFSLSDTINLCSEIITMFEDNGIDIIRTGLYSDDDFTKNDIVAGPYHPAFGELCQSRIFYDKAFKLIKNNSDIIIYVPKGCVSKMRGQKNENIRRLCEEKNIKNIYVKEDLSLEKKDICIREV